MHGMHVMYYLYYLIYNYNLILPYIATSGLYLCVRRRSKDVATSLHVARRLLRRGGQMTLVDNAIFESEPRAQKTSRRVAMARKRCAAPRTSRTLSVPRGSCSAMACKRLLAKLFNSLSRLHSKKKVDNCCGGVKSCLPGNHAWLSVKRILKPNTATNVVLRAWSTITVPCSCVSVAVHRLPDTVKYVSVFHVTTSTSRASPRLRRTTSTCNSHTRRRAPEGRSNPCTEYYRTCARPSKRTPSLQETQTLSMPRGVCCAEACK
jgi:hypothetical protein